jgi:hypothetical protein
MIYVLNWRFIFRVLKGWPNGIVYYEMQVG